MISTSAYGTKWYITLFANSVPFATQLRLWDGFLLEGLDFLVVTAVAIIWHFQREQLLSLPLPVTTQVLITPPPVQTISPLPTPRSSRSSPASRPTSSSNRTTPCSAGSARRSG